MTRSGLGLLALVVLSGCKLEAQIAVVGDGPRPRFDVTYDRGKAACVQGLTVTDLSDGARRDVWAIRRIDARDAAGCVAKVAFGVTPPGYETAVAGGQLVKGRRYEVSANGAGWQAQAPVVVRGA